MTKATQTNTVMWVGVLGALALGGFFLVKKLDEPAAAAAAPKQVSNPEPEDLLGGLTGAISGIKNIGGILGGFF